MPTPMPMNEESKLGIEVKGLSFTTHKKTLLQPLSIQVKKGTCFAVVGHNGAGKTTFFHLLFGLKIPTQGSILIDGKSSLDYSSRAGVGYVPERPYLNPELKLQSFLKLHADLIGLPVAEIPAEILRVAEGVGLKPNLHQSFKTFSKGMLQKSVLAQAMLGNPSLMVLDEPMSGLDPETRDAVRARILNWKSEGKTIVFSSHAIEDVDALADRVLVLKSGTLQFEGSVEEWRRVR